MKIAFIGQKGIPAKNGGIDKHVEELAVRMAKEGHEVFVYSRTSYPPKGIGEYKGVRIIRIPCIHTKHLHTITHTFFSIFHIILNKYDVVHFHGIGPSSLCWIVKFFKPRVALIGTFHSQDYFHNRWGRFAQSVLRFGESVICNVPDRTITVSKSLGEMVSDTYKRHPVVIPNGAEVERTEDDSFLKKWRLEDRKYFLTLGRLIKHKGAHYVVEAFKRLEDSDRLPEGFKLVVAGEGFHTDDYVQYLKTLSGGRKSIIFIGRQSRENLRQLFSHAYLFVQPSESEGLSMNLLEAMGYGLAPLVSDIKGNVEPVGQCGYYFESGNASMLADRMAYLVNSPNEVRRSGEKAKERVKNEYSWNSVAEKTLDLYRDAILSKLSK